MKHYCCIWAVTVMPLVKFLSLSLKPLLNVKNCSFLLQFSDRIITQIPYRIQNIYWNVCAYVVVLESVLYFDRQKLFSGWCHQYLLLVSLSHIIRRIYDTLSHINIIRRKRTLGLEVKVISHGVISTMDMILYVCSLNIIGS